MAGTRTSLTIACHHELMSDITQAHAHDLGEVFAVVESIESWNGRGLPRGADPRFWRALDHLKHAGAPETLLTAAERMGLNLFRLQGTLLNVDADMEVSSYKRELAKLGREWLGCLPMGLSR